jgi:hypothetical protein
MDSDGWLTCGHTHGMRKNGLPWNHWYFRAGFKQVTPEAVNWLQATYGGNVCRQSGANSKLSKRDMFLWQMTGSPLVAFIEAIRPYMLIKGAHADVVLSYYTNYQSMKRFKRCESPQKDAELARRSALHQQLKALNRPA